MDFGRSSAICDSNGGSEDLRGGISVVYSIRCGCAPALDAEPAATFGNHHDA
jgi:hypothetical protein